MTYNQLGLLLRFLRNMCAAGSSAADVLLQHSVQDEALMLALELHNRCQLPLSQHQPSAHAAPGQAVNAADTRLLLVCLQLVANLAVSSSAAAAAIWQQSYPSKFIQLTSVQHGEHHLLGPTLPCFVAQST